MNSVRYLAVFSEAPVKGFPSAPHITAHCHVVLHCAAVPKRILLCRMHSASLWRSPICRLWVGNLQSIHMKARLHLSPGGQYLCFDGSCGGWLVG